jgi:hypothetical protein
VSGDSNSFIIDEIGKIAEAANHLVVVKENQLFLVNRNQDASTPQKTFRAPDLLKVDIKQGMPIRRLTSEYQQNIPYPHSRRLERQTQTVNLQIQPYGQDVEVDSLSQVETEVEKFLSAYYEIVKRPRCSATVQGIYNYQIGDVVEAFDEILEALVKITIDTIKWSFKEETTTFDGHSVITHMKDY